MTDCALHAGRPEVGCPDKPDRLAKFFRLLWVITVAVIFALVSGTAETVTATVILNEAGETMKITRDTAGGLVSGLAAATALILFRQRHPRRWFDFARELARFWYRVGACLCVLTDQHRSTVEERADSHKCCRFVLLLVMERAAAGAVPIH